MHTRHPTLSVVVDIAARALSAAALALALSGPAHAQAPAQPGVTLYGLLDIALGSFQGASAGVKRGDASVKQALGGGMSTSHFGLRGSEDLGGGLVAAFELSSFMRNDTGQSGRNDAIGPPVSVAADPFWSRAAWVGLGSAAVGRVRLGAVTTPMFVNSITSNAFGDSTVFSPLNLVTFIGSPLSGGTGWTNVVAYDSPNLGGVVGTLAVSASEGQGGRNSGGRLAWSGGAAGLSLAWQRVDKNPSTFADGTSPNNTRAWQLAASYDFQVVRVWAHLGSIDNRGTEAAPLSVGYRIAEVSAAVPLGAGRLLMGYARRRTGDTPAPVPATAAGGNLERRVATVGYEHLLSRRTDLYLMAMQDRTETRTLPAPPTTVAASGRSLALGLRHRF